jgi:hypothetical protein
MVGEEAFEFDLKSGVLEAPAGLGGRVHMVGGRPGRALGFSVPIYKQRRASGLEKGGELPQSLIAELVQDVESQDPVHCFLQARAVASQHGLEIREHRGRRLGAEPVKHLGEFIQSKDFNVGAAPSQLNRVGSGPGAEIRKFRGRGNIQQSRHFVRREVCEARRVIQFRRPLRIETLRLPGAMAIVGMVGARSHRAIVRRVNVVR